jgi:uridylate kinase
MVFIILIQKKRKDAIKFEYLTFDDAIKKKLKVMDSTAFTLSKENNLPIIVFNINKPGNLKKVIDGKQVGTIVN